MVPVKKEGVILSKSVLPFESRAVLNPAVISTGSKLYMFYRAVDATNCSTIGCCELTDPLTIKHRFTYPILSPEGATESKGIEDPRIVNIDGYFLLTYTAYDGFNALGALAISTDLFNFQRHGVIVPILSFAEFKVLAQQDNKINEKYARFSHDKTEMSFNTKLLVWDKDVIFFPRRINNQLYILHRIKPDIQIACVQELSELNELFWKNYLLKFSEHILLEPSTHMK